MKRIPLTRTIILGLLLAGLTAGAREEAVVTAVFSDVSNGYARQKLPDGTFKREYYAISNAGGYTPGQGKDPSIDNMQFPQVAGVLAEHLARQNYFLARDAKSADILLCISWGTTIPFNDGATRQARDGLFTAINTARMSAGTPAGGDSSRSADGIQSPQAAVAQAAQSEVDGQLIQMQMFETMRQKANEHNALLLGYLKEVNDHNTIKRFAGGGDYFNDLIADIEEERYYVIVAAYDFRAVTQKHEKKLLWATRVSVRAQGNRFDEQLQTMLANASRQFGRNSGGLIRKYQEGSVRLDELKIVGVVAKPTAPAKPPEGK